MNGVVVALGSLVEGWELEVVAAAAFILAACVKFAVSRRAARDRPDPGPGHHAEPLAFEDTLQGPP